MGIATLYRRYPSRELLVEAVYRNESQRLASAADELLDELEPIEALTRWCEQFLEYLATKSGMAQSLRLLLTTDEGLRLQTRTLLIDACDRLLRTAANAGQARDGIEATECDIVTTGLKETVHHVLAFARRASRPAMQAAK